MKTSNSVLSAVLVSVLGLSAALNAPQALAEDGKNYPAYMCKQWSGTGTTRDSYMSIGNNSSTGGVFLDCPVVKDSIDHTISSGWVRATDRHDSEHINCLLVSAYRDPISSAPRYYTDGRDPQYTGGSSTIVQKLDFKGVNAVPFGHYYYTCYIPPTHNGNVSEIHTYNVIENE